MAAAWPANATAAAGPKPLAADDGAAANLGCGAPGLGLAKAAKCVVATLSPPLASPDTTKGPARATQVTGLPCAATTANAGLAAAAAVADAAGMVGPDPGAQGGRPLRWAALLGWLALLGRPSCSRDDAVTARKSRAGGASRVTWAAEAGIGAAGAGAWLLGAGAGTEAVAVAASAVVAGVLSAAAGVWESRCAGAGACFCAAVLSLNAAATDANKCVRRGKAAVGAAAIGAAALAAAAIEAAAGAAAIEAAAIEATAIGATAAMGAAAGAAPLGSSEGQCAAADSGGPIASRDLPSAGVAPSGSKKSSGGEAPALKVLRLRLLLHGPPRRRTVRTVPSAHPTTAWLPQAARPSAAPGSVVDAEGGPPSSGAAEVAASSVAAWRKPPLLPLLPLLLLLGLAVLLPKRKLAPKRRHSSPTMSGDSAATSAGGG
jgi:SWI/SNF-related matrix-associated actin-dependent regulator 1 of chromatin subfamily A